MRNEDKLTFRTKISECCGNDDLRPAMKCVYFTTDSMYATDGTIIIRQPLNLQTIQGAEFLAGKLLHKDSYNAVMAADIATADDQGIMTQKENGQTAFYDYFDAGDAQFPDVEKVINQYLITDYATIHYFGLNTRIVKVIKAFHAPNGIKIEFTKTGFMVATTPDIANQIAILPMENLNEALKFDE